MKESEDNYRFSVKTATSPHYYCLKCGIVTNLYKHGKKQQLFFDLPMHAKRVGIYGKRLIEKVQKKTSNERPFKV